MIFNANEILKKVVGEGDHKPCSVRVSKSVLENFKNTCQKDGAKNYSPILEEIIKSFLSYVDDGNPVKIHVLQTNDRGPTSFSCSIKVWEAFIELLPELGLDRTRVLEYLMEEYCRQRSKR